MRDSGDRSAARERNDLCDVRCNKHPCCPLRREGGRERGEPDDVGAAAAYLLGEDARNVTGTTLYVDGGYHAMGM